MANAFTKQELVVWEDQLAKFEDMLSLSKNVTTYRMSAQDMERSNNVFWRPQPYIAKSFQGVDQTGNFVDYTGLSVPSSLGFSSSVPWGMSATELNDAVQSNRIGEAAMQKVASDINLSIAALASLQGTLVVKRTGAPTGYDDIADADAMMMERGINYGSRYMHVQARDYNKIAGNLAQRQTMQGKPTSAYEDAYVGRVAGFETYKADYTYSLAAATATGVTVNGANQFYTPRATSTASTGEQSNVDNRYQTIAITVGGSTVKVGDAFTIANVFAVHPITKASTGQLMTFRVTAIVTGAGGTGTVTISPPIISGGGATVAEQIYQNVTATPAAGAAITFLNTATTNAAPFWADDAIEIIPGKYAVEQGAGLNQISTTTEQGITVTVTKQAKIENLKSLYRVDARWGAVMKQPLMAGVLLMNQI